MLVLVNYTATERLRNVRHGFTSGREAEIMVGLVMWKAGKADTGRAGRDCSSAHVALPIQIERSLEGRLWRRSALNFVEVKTCMNLQRGD